MKKHRFFYHYHKSKRKMSIHYRKSCLIVDNVVCNVPCETKWNKQQPRLVMRGFCKEIKVVDKTAYIA